MLEEKYEVLNINFHPLNDLAYRKAVVERVIQYG